MSQTLEHYMSLHYPVKLIPRENGSYFAIHPDLQGCMAQGATADEAVRNLRDSREVWIEARLKGGHAIPEPAAEDEYSGKFLLRMSSRLHAGLAEAAANQNLSLNQLINNVLSEYLGGERLRDSILEAVGRSMQEALRLEMARLSPLYRPLSGSFAGRDQATTGAWTISQSTPRTATTEAQLANVLPFDRTAGAAT